MWKSKLLIILAVILLLGGSATLYLFITAPKVPEPKFQFPSEEITYTYYRPDDGANAVVRAALDEYEDAHPNVTVDLKTFPAEEYTQVLANALKFRDPPNLYSFDSSELTGLLPRLSPSPVLTYDAESYKRDFHNSTHLSVVSGGLFGIPLRVLPYVYLVNEEEFKRAGVSVPAIWSELVEAAPKMREVDGIDLKKGAIALGTANLLHEPEILTLLMLQNGGNILAADLKSAVFAEPSGSFFPGAEAIKFYGAFADPSKATYAYNSFQPRAIKAYEDGEIASFIGTQEDASSLEAKGKKVSVHSLLQISNEKKRSVLRLPLEGVHPNTPHQQVAWDILQYLSSKTVQERIFKSTGILTPHRKVIEKAKSNGSLRIYLDELENGQVIVKVNSSMYDSMMRRIVTRYFSGQNPQFVLDSEQKSFTEYLRNQGQSDIL